MSRLRQLAVTGDRVSRVHLPVYLQNVALGFSNRAMIADIVSPVIPVNRQSNKYRIWGKNQFLQAESRWAPGTVPNALSFRWSDDQYFAEEYKLRIPLLDQERQNSDSDIQLETRYTGVVTNAVIVNREARVAALFTDATKYSASHKIAKAGGAEWDQAAQMGNSQAITDMQNMIIAVAQDAMVPTTDLTVVIPEPVFLQALQNNTGILDRIKYSATGVVTTDLLRAVLNVKQVILAASMSAGQGPEVAGSDVVTGFATTYLWGDTVWIGLVNDLSTEERPTFSASFNWSAATQGQRRMTRVYRDPDEGKEQDWIEVKEAMDEKLVFADGGAIITNCLSTI